MPGKSPLISKANIECFYIYFKIFCKNLHIMCFFKNYKCNVNGAQGDGTAQGTCDSGFVCNDDGSCTMCAVTNSFPHNGCTTLNPICNGGTSCVCDPASSLSCSSDNHSICDGYATMSPFSGGSCICGTTAGMGTNSACTGELPSCKAANFAAVTDSTSAICQVKTKRCNVLEPMRIDCTFL